MAELVDAVGLGPIGIYPVGVRLSLPARYLTFYLSNINILLY